MFVSRAPIWYDLRFLAVGIPFVRCSRQSSEQRLNSTLAWTHVLFRQEVLLGSVSSLCWSMYTCITHNIVCVFHLFFSMAAEAVWSGVQQHQPNNHSELRAGVTSCHHSHSFPSLDWSLMQWHSMHLHHDMKKFFFFWCVFIYLEWKQKRDTGSKIPLRVRFENKSKQNSNIQLQLPQALLPTQLDHHLHGGAPISYRADE